MAWADWMVVELSLEDELQLERQARAILSHDDHSEIAKLCSTLVKQTHYQQVLLGQAVDRITELETQNFIEELDEESLKVAGVTDLDSGFDSGLDRRMSWWRRILSAD